MAQPLWLVSALAGCTLLFVLGQYLARREDGAGTGHLPVASPHEVDPQYGVAIREGECPSCGAENDAEYTYCRECTSRLGPAGPSGE
ncbi:MAG: hypothetical protein ABEJ04_00915 [Halobacteriaceae archaeon]